MNVSYCLEITSDWPPIHPRRLSVTMARRKFFNDVVLCKITKKHFAPDVSAPGEHVQGICATWEFPSPFALETYWNSIVPKMFSMCNGEPTRMFIAHSMFKQDKSFRSMSCLLLLFVVYFSTQS